MLKRAFVFGVAAVSLHLLMTTNAAACPLPCVVAGTDETNPPTYVEVCPPLL